VRRRGAERFGLLGKASEGKPPCHRAKAGVTRSGEFPTAKILSAVRLRMDGESTDNTYSPDLRGTAWRDNSGPDARSVTG
jgi:hypothetical protein